jgi:hypothetical protein
LPAQDEDDPGRRKREIQHEGQDEEGPQFHSLPEVMKS